MNQSAYEKFANVKMPRWYRLTAWGVRVVGFLTLLGCAWKMTHEEAPGSLWAMGGLIVGFLLLVLPSLPKAYIEQRNRIRGLRDGSFKEFLDNERGKRR